MEIQVARYSGYIGEETPRSIIISGKKIEMVDLVGRWLAPDHRYFKFIGSDSGIYIIRHDTYKYL